VKVRGSTATATTSGAPDAGNSAEDSPRVGTELPLASAFAPAARGFDEGARLRAVYLVGLGLA
jgi:hypothetical protein